MSNFAIIAAAFRHNTGASILDSGGAYGRYHEQPPIEEVTPMVTMEVYSNEVLATIETAHFLSESCDVDTEIQAQFDEWVAREENSELTWFEAGKQFATEVLELTQQARDNTCNNEQDLSQNYVWEVYTQETDPSDWIYADDALLVVYAHTGCDVRGGYAYPLFLKCSGDYAIPTDLCAEFYASEGKLNGVELEDDELRALDEEWSCGYASHPGYHMNKQIERVFSHTQKGESVIVKLKSGEVVRIHASARTY